MKYFYSFMMMLSLNFLFAKPIVSVSIPPQAYLLKQIAQETLEIHTLIPQDLDPHTFEFKPQTLSKLQKSDLYLTIGLEFEKIWIPKFQNTLKQTQIISITQGIDFIASSEKDHHKHEEHEHHHHSSYDPHIWLSPMNAKILAQNIAKILITHFPKHQNLYEKNLKNLLARLDALHQNIAQQLLPLKTRKFLVYHPAWAYFAREFHLEEISIQNEGQEPKPQMMKEIIAKAKKDQIRTIFIQNGFSTQSAKVIAKSCNAVLWNSNPLAYHLEQELLHFTSGLLQ